MTERMTGEARLVLTVAVLGSFVAFLDSTVVTVALPAISRELGGGLATQQWAVDAYLVTLGALILVAGAASDACGRILVLRIGLIGFGIASLAVAAAPSIELLIAARAVQGTAGAFLVPSSLALITGTMTDPVRSRAIGLWTAFTTGAMIVGPLLGGILVDQASWRWAFVLNVLPVSVALALLPKLRAHDQRQPGARIDWVGATLCTAGLGLGVLALIELPTAGSASGLLWGALGVGALLFLGFLLRGRTAPQPLLPLDLFRERTFASGNLATAFIYAALALNGFVVAVYLQQSAGLSATLAGLASLPTTLLMIALSSRIGLLAGRYGPRVFMSVGPLLMAVGCLLLLTVGSGFDYWWQVLPSMIALGLGLAITVAPLTSAILGSADAARSGIASAVNNAVARVAGLLGVAFLGAVTGGALDLDGFHRVALTTAGLFVAGAVTSAIGVRNRHPRPSP